MRFLNNQLPFYELTYSDVFLVPNFNNIPSRFNVDLTTPDKIGTNIPIVVANMSAIAGKRMAETVARRGGLTILPQNVPIKVLKDMLDYIKNRHLIFETPLTLGPTNTIMEALNIIHKRAHKTIIVIDEKQHPLGLFTEKDASGYDRFTLLGQVIKKPLLTVADSLQPKAMYEFLNSNNIESAPVLKSGQVIGIITKKSCLRSTIYKPATNSNGQLLTAAAIGINGDVKQKTEQLVSLGVDILVLDTAHGYQQKMLSAIKSVRSISPTITLVAGNVVTYEATIALLEAGANIIKVGIGPGAMCTTRMMTGVGRPQFSTILDCAKAAEKLGGQIWADGGIRHPRDVALALAAGASNVMIGSWFASTYESTGDVLRDNDGRLYKENYGMASKRAVKNRSQDDTSYEQALKEQFEEGISSSKLYIDEDKPGVEDIIDQIVAGLRSSMTYLGAETIADFQKKAIIGIQSSAGYKEGMAVGSSWS